MKYVTGVVLELTDSDIGLFMMNENEKDARGWLLDFCESESSDCLSELNRFFVILSVFFMSDIGVHILKY